ncbi:PAS domain-containing protein [Candidatus Latescibacterota bacterium]
MINREAVLEYDKKFNGVDDCAEDITDYEKTEKNLKEINKIISRSPVVIFNWKNEEKWPVEFVSGNVEKLFGYTEEDFTSGKITYEEVIYPDDLERVSKEVEKTSKDKKSDKFEHEPYRIITKTGKVKWIDDRTYILRNDKGEITHFQGIVLNITKRKRIEESLHKSKEKYRLLTENTNDVVLSFDTEGIITYIGPQVATYGYKPEEIISTNFMDYVLPKDRERVLINFQKTLATGDEIPTHLRILDKNGHTHCMEEYGKIQYDEFGTIIGINGVLRNITERKQSEKKLKEFKKIVNRTPAVVFVCRFEPHEWPVEFVSDNVIHSLGYTVDEFMSGEVTGMGITYPEDVQRLQAEIAKYIKEGKVEWSQEYRLIMKSGEVRWFSDQSLALKDSKGNITHIQSIILDITERKQLEEERAKSSRLKSIGLLAGGIAHDFNNILSAILGNTSLAKMNIDNKNELLELFTETEKATIRASKLTQQLLTFAKGGTPVKETSELSELIRETTGFSLRGSNVKYRSSIAPNLKFADVDKGQFGQVIGNLVINAKQAMPNGGTINIKAENVSVKYRDNLPLSEGDYIKISVSDKGHGIPKEYLSKIFDPYITLKKEGNGLGLATAYSIVHRHNGHITVESKVGVGTTFHLYIPASLEIVKNEEKAKEDSDILTGRILVMDDEISIRKVVKMMLRCLGNEVEVASDGEEAVKLYKKAMDCGKPFNAVIMDLTIPGAMGGKEAIQRIQKIDPLAKAIVSSGYSNDPVISNYKKYGFCGYILKPYRLKELTKTMNIVFKM